ncbi:MAG: ABC transporter permease [Terracidiphilus sp.]|jgi:putative ABC transport system permease protein
MAQGQTRESIKMAFDTLRTNKLRSGLTVLGIVIGVTTVITMSSVINGLNNRVSDWVSSLGSNVFWVFHMPVIGVRPTMEQLARKKLTLDDVVALRTLPHVVAADGGHQHVKAQFRVGDVAVKYNGKKVAGTILQGSTADVALVSDFTFIQGRLFTDDEDQRASHVVVLGHDTWQELFGDQNAIGKEVNIETGLYTVIGVLDKRKQPFGGGKNPNDNAAFFPLNTFHNLHPEDKDMWVSVKYDDPKNKAFVEDEIREMLRIRRKVKVEAPDDFEIFGPDSLSKLWNQLTGGLVLFMIAVSSVGLMVGGVGVMNIMLVAVTERTREIGVRKALGATKRTILTQFTTEAVTLCAVGGIIGIILGAVLTWIVYLLPIGLPATLSTLWVLIGFGVSCTIGLLFGIYPAWKAANLDPIEALRYE